ncbi:hypothetical protein [Arthrobacter sp. MYb227]|uniref:hypothetical protein n=1 Tax=Arthrobacter sp. MYb227 TaxID=1848601 RepID=UPI0011B0A277|nr:hypothetical protein [Arthrobacter sp. MYb227]
MRLKVLATGSIALALIIGASYLPIAAGWPVSIVLLVVLAVFAAGWPRLLKVPSPNPVSLLIFIGSAAATILASFPLKLDSAGMLWLAPIIGVGAIFMFLTQLFRGTDAKARLESVAIGISGLVIGSLGSGWVALGSNTQWRAVALIAGLSIFAAAIPGVLRLPDRIVFPLGFLLAVLVGGAASMFDNNVNVVPGLVLGAACGLVIVGARAMLVSARGPRNTLQMLAASSAPLLLCGAVVWYVHLIRLEFVF